MKMPIAMCTGLLATLLAHANASALPELPALPAPPAVPAPAGIAPPPPPPPPAPPTPVIPEEAIAACAAKASGEQIDITTADGMRVTGTCSKSVGKIRFEVESIQIGRYNKGGQKR